MGYRPDETEEKIVFELENADRAESEGNPHAGEGSAISEEARVKFESDDITPDTKQKIGQYLKCELEDEAAQSEAEIANSPPSPESLRSARAEQPTQPGNDSFIASQSDEGRRIFEQSSNSTQLPVKMLLGKGSISKTTKRRADFYADVDENLGDSQLALVAENLVEENARFSSKEGNTPYVTPNRPTEEEAGTGEHLFHQRLGVYSPRSFPDTPSPEDKAVAISRLQDLGLRVLMKSSGEIHVPTDSSTGQVTLARTAALVPGLARLGFRLPFNRFTAASTLEDVIEDDVRKGSVEIDLDGLANPSYGNVNNPLVPFAAVTSSVTAVIVGTLLSLTMSAIMQALAALLSSDVTDPFSAGPFASEPTISRDPAGRRRRRLGSYKEVEEEQPGISDALLSVVGLGGGFKDFLLKTNNDYQTAVTKGTQVFFGQDENSGGFGANITSVVGGVHRISESPGYYVTVLRGLVRAFSDVFIVVGNAAAGLAGGESNVAAFRKTNYDVDKLSGPASDPFALLDIINVIKESKFIKFMNIMAGIGDIAIDVSSGDPAIRSTIDRILDTTSVGAGGEGEPDLRINPAALVKRNRLSQAAGDNKGPDWQGGVMAWGTSVLPAKYLLNTNRVKAERLYAGKTEQIDDVTIRLGGDERGHKDLVRKIQENRLDAEEVAKIEEELDSYYVPFYFHDLRTNEIVPFHAFLDSMSDSFSVDYSETQGYGRIGTVHSYKNTTRNISVTFKIVATGKSDFDHMWFKINKLVMMLFPQYTRGRPISYQEGDNTFSFIQPFSQLPSSSPMIRLRIGDVFKSNYSDLELARLFGLGQQGFSIPEMENVEISEGEENERLERMRTTRERQGRFEFEVDESFVFVRDVQTIGNRSVNEIEDQGLVLTVIESSGPGGLVGAAVSAVAGGGNEQPQPIHIGAGCKAKITDVVTAGHTYKIELVPAPSNVPSTYQVEIIGNQPVASMIRFDPSEPANFGPSLPLGLSSNTNADAAEENAANLAVSNFFDGNDDGTSFNPIYKSFDSTRGEGVAGFIKSLNFDWNDAVWETEELNSRAPKWITVQLEFAPVYDLNPGLDSDGNMIAPIYNVGAIMNALKVQRTRNGTGVDRTSRVQRFADRRTSASPGSASDTDPNALDIDLGIDVNF
jgi:hypothetical protein